MAVRTPGRIVAVAISLILTTACAGPDTTPGPTQASLAPASRTTVTPAPATPPPTSFSSAVLPYTVVLPAGWVELSTSGEEDGYESEDLQWTLAVGTGHPEPGHVVEDRVRINRESEFANCDTRPETDRSVTVGGERGIVWEFSCGAIFGLAANTIHDGVGYRLTLRNYGNAADQLEAVMAGILAGFAFTD